MFLYYSVIKAKMGHMKSVEGILKSVRLRLFSKKLFIARSVELFPYREDVSVGLYLMQLARRGEVLQIAESGLGRPHAAACANSGRRGMGRFPRKCKLRGPCGVACG